MRSATVRGRSIQTGTLISYSTRRGARPGSTLGSAGVETDPEYPKSSHKNGRLVRSQMADSSKTSFDGSINDQGVLDIDHVFLVGRGLPVSGAGVSPLGDA